MPRDNIYILLVYSPFSDRVGLSLHNTPFPGVLIKSIGEAFFDRMPFLTSTCDVCIWHMFVFMLVVVTVWGSVGMFVV